MADYGFEPYVPVAEKQAINERALQKLRKKNPDIRPVRVTGRALAKTWWGKAWNNNLESYADYAYRIDRGRSYVRQGAVLDLQITTGQVTALVQGSRSKPYQVTVVIDPPAKAKWQRIVALCNEKIDTVEALVNGQFPQELAALFTAQGDGLFPTPREIHFDCSCPDWAGMCKHVAAVLYGIGVRLDEEPLLFFTLRDMTFETLIKKSIEDKMQSMLKNAGRKSQRALDDSVISDLFGI